MGALFFLSLFLLRALLPEEASVPVEGLVVERELHFSHQILDFFHFLDHAFNGKLLLFW